MSKIREKFHPEINLLYGVHAVWRCYWALFMCDLHTYMYSLLLFLPLPLFTQACTLPISGRLVAYQMLCDMTIKHSHTPPSSKQLAHFYRLMHRGLQPSSVSAGMHVRGREAGSAPDSVGS